MRSLGIPVLKVRRFLRRIGVRVAGFAVLAVMVALLAPLIQSMVGEDLSSRVDQGAVMPVLTILASSMLAVSTFSINVMVSAYRAAADAATPRVHRLLLEDTTTQTVLLTFMGAFIYALFSILLVQAGLMPEDSALPILVVTAFVVLLVIMAMLSWIDHLSVLGSVDHSLETASARAEEALRLFAEDPTLGATPLIDDMVMPPDLHPVTATCGGYIELIDVAALEHCLPEHAVLYVERTPGEMVLTGTVLARMSTAPDAETLDALRSAFVIGEHRSYEQDPIFGLMVLAEIASKALSPGVNDPGTAINAMDRATSLLWDHARLRVDAPEPHHPTVFVPVIPARGMIEATFSGAVREGAAMPEVVGHLLKSLEHLSTTSIFSDAALDMARRALAHAEKAMAVPADYERLAQRFGDLREDPSSG
ncbi:MAG: DUF2254 domain-containing protein [Pseudomonadota bacterium]